MSVLSTVSSVILFVRVFNSASLCPLSAAGAPCYSKPPSLLGPYPRNPPFDYPWSFNPYLPGAFSLNNCPKLAPGSLYQSHFYPNPLPTSLSQLPNPFSSLLPPGDGAERVGAQAGGAAGTVGGLPARLCMPPYSGTLALSRTEMGNGGTGERERCEGNAGANGGLGLGIGLGLGLGLGGVALGNGGGRQSPAERRGAVKQDPESDSELEITDLSDCSSDNENEPEFIMSKEGRLSSRSQILEAKTATPLPPLSSLTKAGSPRPLKSVAPSAPSTPSLPSSLSPSLSLVDRHRQTEALKLTHS